LKTIAFYILLLASLSLQAQRIITGTVLSTEDNLPLPGATILETGTYNGTTTLFDGTFSIEVSDTAKSITISFIGFQSKIVTITDNIPLHISLKPESQNIEEVVVSVPYSQQKKGSFTGAVSLLQPRTIVQVPNTSIDKTLQGNVAGVQLSSNSGEPGSSSEIKIRGIGSISASSSPLFVLDGIPIESKNLNQIYSSGNIMSTLNNAEIASITVLKDAAATSLYGSRASNGVIMITTKKGSGGDTKFQFNTVHGISTIAMNGYRLLNADEYLSLKTEGMQNAGYSEFKIIEELDNTGYETNWMDEIYRPAYSSSYSLSAQGGNKHTQFFTIGAYSNDQGVRDGTNQEKMSARLNMNHSVNNKLKFDEKLMISHTKNNTGHGAGDPADAVTGAYILSPTIPVYTDGEYNFADNVYNVVGINALDINQYSTLRFIGNASGEYSFTDNLLFKTTGNIDLVNLEENKYIHPETPDGKAKNGIGYLYTTKQYTWTSSSYVKYSKTLQKDHSIMALVGTEAQKSETSYSQMIASNFPMDEYKDLSSAAEYDHISSYRSPWSILSFFSNAQYNFKHTYYLSGSLRCDGSSKFLGTNRWGNFWSVGCSWRISKEKFLENIAWINTLKLRASYGTSGNSDIDNHAALSLVTFGYNYNGEPGASFTQLGNKNLTWEKNNNADIGIDFLIFKRFSGNIELYRRRTWDLLLDAPISMTNGFEYQTQNIGEMINSGIEISLNTENIKRKKFSWKTDFSFSTNLNKVTILYEGDAIVSGSKIHEEGIAYNTFYLKNWAGVNPANGVPLWYDSNGNITFDYENAGYRQAGTSDPKWISGITNTVSFGNFDVSCFIYIHYGNKIYNNMNEYLLSDGAQANMNQTSEALSRWQKQGDETDVPMYMYGNSSNSNKTSTRYLEDGSYARLKSVRVQYRLKESMLMKFHATKCSLFLQGTNLYTITNYSGIDPEQNFAGLAFFSYPNVRQVNFGIEIGF